tara:strand:+ start:244 stop:402 length:159 start_codon:yes stop_codon:yes gene_type:complete
MFFAFFIRNWHPEYKDIKSIECCILGAGPAGLGAALELVNNGVTDIIIVDKE